MPRLTFAFVLTAVLTATPAPAQPAAAPPAAGAERGGSAASEPHRPNLVFILADDLGYHDTSTYGSRFHHTPNIDRLARRGMLFTRAYAASPLCSPTRASILTGLYPARIGLTTASGHLPEAATRATLPERARPDRRAIEPRSATRLDTRFLTFAEVLRDAGYVTAHFGKWHLGAEPFSPLQQGFELDVPHYPGAGPPGNYLKWKLPAELKFAAAPGEHLEDRMAREAAGFIRRHRDRPFVLNYWAYSVHGPWVAKPELVEHYRKQARDDQPQRNPTYAAMVHSLDDAVGTLLDTLDEAGIADRTIVVFFSDNGGVHWLDDRMRNNFGFDGPPTSNAPLRGGKATLYEGGTREPCIITWPGRTPPGSRSDALLSSVDFFPTLLEMMNVAVPAGWTGDGVSQVPALLGSGAPREAVYCYFPHYTPATGNIPGVWVRQGDWKLIRFFHDNPDGAHRLELYNLRDDAGETRNLAAEQPERVDVLNRLIDRHLQQTGALLPRPNPVLNLRSATAPAESRQERRERRAREAAVPSESE